MVASTLVSPGLAVTARPRWTRRRRLGLRFAPLCLLLALLISVPVRVWTRPPAHVPLAQDGVGVGADGRIVALTGTDRLVPGTRVLAGTPDADRLAAQERAWLAAGTVPQPSELGDSTMTTDALLDLKVLTTAGGQAPIAGWSGPWRYVWPRDSSFAAVAFARTGHLDEADGILDTLQQVQAADGTFQARYRPGQDAPPDDRGVQLDGTGWALWALNEVAEQTPVAERAVLIRDHTRLLTRSVALISARTAGGRLPVSSDYWETTEHRATLATSALLLAGLSAAADCYRTLGDPQAEAIDAEAASFRSRVLAGFGPGFPRRLGGWAGSADLGVAFLLPPFGAAAEPATVNGWQHSLDAMARPTGGLAPGGSWKDDGISWTPTTATEAITAAALGDRTTAVRLLRWLDAHRTGQGTIPEKVLADGSLAAVAPLSWSAAATVIAADELQRGQ